MRVSVDWCFFGMLHHTEAAPRISLRNLVLI